MTRRPRLRKLGFDFERERAVRRLGVIIAVAGAVLAAAAVNDYVETARRVSLSERRLAELKRMSQRRDVPIPESQRDPAELKREIRVANAVLQQISVPWDTLFEELEKSGGKGVALLSVQPDMQSGVVRLGGEAKNLAALVDYTRRLHTSRVLSGIHVLNHEVRAQDPQKPVIFSLVATWR